MKDTSPCSPDPAWLAEWLQGAQEASAHRSIVIGSKCSADLQSIGSKVAGYLNEFDYQSEGRWHAFSHTELYRIAGDPSSREMVLHSVLPDPHPGPPDSDLDRVARRIARLGGAVLEGQYSLDATTDLDTAFRVCLCGTHPACLEPCHIWLNPTTFSHESLVTVIADSFLDWTSRRPETDTDNALPPARAV